MEWQFVLLIILIIISIILIMPQLWQFRFYINVMNNLGVISLSFFGIPLVCFQVELSELGLNIIRTKKDDKHIDFTLLDKETIFLEKFLNLLLKKINIKKLLIYFDSGKLNDACIPCIYSGIFYTFAYSILAILYEKRGKFNAFLSTKESTDNDEIALSGYLSIILSFFTILLVMTKSWLKTKKVVAEYERILRQNENR